MMNMTIMMELVIFFCGNALSLEITSSLNCRDDADDGFDGVNDGDYDDDDNY